jgi:hypothetical protein
MRGNFLSMIQVLPAMRRCLIMRGAMGGMTGIFVLLCAVLKEAFASAR